MNKADETLVFTKKLKKPALKPGLALRPEPDAARYLRITHVFDNCIYGIWVTTPEYARDARRPSRFTTSQLNHLEAKQGAHWGVLSLPQSLSHAVRSGTDEERKLRQASELIKPLISALEQEKNLRASNFSALITARAKATDTSPTTVRRTLIRHYYFGGAIAGLLSLPRGAKPSTTAPPTASNGEGKRRGRKSVMEKVLGSNLFVVTNNDIEDMLACLRKDLSKSSTYLSLSYENYLSDYFSNRHPAIYKSFLAKEIPLPVSERQFRYYIDLHLRIDKELEKNLRSRDHRRGRSKSLMCSGPGEIYEMDATGGRIYLISNDPHPVVLGKPSIYLVIDRWSRYVVSVYISLQPASFEEARQALLVCFTSRERFSGIGLAVSNKDWPPAAMPAVVCYDRGSEFIGNAMETAIASDLLIELTALPPFCADGKGIVERLIRELKRRMAGKVIPGTFAERPINPIAKRAARKAETAAALTLREIYQVLIDIVIDHNTRPHKSLRRMKVLTRNSVTPTPREAYLWGLENISGLQAAPLADSDYERLLLHFGQARLTRDGIVFKKRTYLPDNDSAHSAARSAPIKGVQVDIRLEQIDPSWVLLPNKHGTWGKFVMSERDMNELDGSTLDEDEAHASQNLALWAQSETDSLRRRLTDRSKAGQVRRKKADRLQLSREELIALRKAETNAIKTQMNPASRKSSGANAPSSTGDWQREAQEERNKLLKRIRESKK